MPYKLCPSCQQASYSACVNSIWLCPYCGKELTLCKPAYDRRCISTQPGEQKPRQMNGALYQFRRPESKMQHTEE